MRLKDKRQQDLQRVKNEIEQEKKICDYEICDNDDRNESKIKMNNKGIYGQKFCDSNDKELCGQKISDNENYK